MPRDGQAHSFADDREDSMKLIMLAEAQRPRVAPPVRLLTLESTSQDMEPALQELRTFGFEVQHTLAARREEFLEALQQGQIDAILADYALPGWTGLDALNELRKRGKDIPFLMVTGTLGEEAAVECIKQGVSDYILKDRLEKLPAALQRALQEKNLRDERACAQATLAESEARAREQLAELEQIYRTAPIGLAVYGPDLRYMRVNEHLAKMNGVSAEKHQGLMTRDVNPEIARAIEPYLRRVFARGESILNVEVQGTTQARLGVVRNWLASFHPLRGANGVIFGISVVVMEITERKTPEAALAASESRNREIVENSAYGIFRIAKDGRLLDPNPALLQILGCPSLDELDPAALVRDAFRFPAQYAECMAACREEGQRTARKRSGDVAMAES